MVLELSSIFLAILNSLSNIFSYENSPLPEALKLAKILSVKPNFLSMGLLRAFVLQFLGYKNLLFSSNI